ncbi:F0F1 ATP synthase subunit B [Tautonia rosea]|uniref:F0F1 ATP synthase subunit B n=1 Tax=Tautonia rosea TaxID=2728037 RepID=UPI001472CF5C|nr:F0F1 ATP synthase subunit B [Tautonia rosea]
MLRRKLSAFGPLMTTLITLTAIWIGGHVSAVAAPPFEDTAQADATHEGEPHGDTHAASEGEINILAAESSLAIYTVIVFFLLLVLLYRFAWGPISKALEDREQSLESAFREAENARAEAAALLEQHRKQMEQVQDQVRQIMDEANRKAETAYQERLSQARSDAEATVERATREISAAKDQAVAELYERSADLAVTVAGQVLRREISGDEHRRLIEVASQELQSVGPNGRGGLS